MPIDFEPRISKHLITQFDIAIFKAFRIDINSFSAMKDNYFLSSSTDVIIDPMIHRPFTKEEMVDCDPTIADILGAYSDDDIINLYKDNLFTCLQSIIRRSNGQMPCVMIRIVDEGSIGGEAVFITADDVQSISLHRWLTTRFNELKATAQPSN